MKLMKAKGAACRVGAAALLAFGTMHAFGQQIPASSADSGRRAVVAVNQGSIYNGINNAYYTGVNAQNSANIAYNTAVNAQAGADGAAGLAGEALRRAAEGSVGAMLGNPIDVPGNGSNYEMLEVQGGSPLPGDVQNSTVIRVACFRGARGPYSLIASTFGDWVACPTSDSRFVALSFPKGKTPADVGGAE